MQKLADKAKKMEPTSNNEQKELAFLCKALSHPIRIEIIKILLSKGECISGDLADNFDKAHSTVSEHLKILKASGLVVGTIEGPKRLYCVNSEAVLKMKQLINLLIFDPNCCSPESEIGEI